MERFDIRGKDWGLMERQDGLGAFTWAEEALAYKRSFWSSFFVNVVMVVVCALLSAYIVFHKHDPVPVQKVVYNRTTGEDTAILRQRIQELEAESKAKDVKLKSSRFVVMQLERQLKELHASVPAQPIILEAVRREASTEEGLQAAVNRNFPGVKVRVVE